MKDPLLAWPAFAPETALPSGAIHYERGIWGKVQGARTDFRWIARSSGLEAGEPELARLLSLGAEDQPETAQLWLHRGSRWYAAGLYPSRARDASGRTNFLEKQVLAWEPPPGTPAALGALLLLPRVATLNADVWWSRSGDPAWEDPRFSLLLPDIEHAPLPVRPEDLAAVVSQGVADLRERVDPQALRRLYARLLEGQPAWLTLDRPLSPQALAVLLLPLPRDRADSLSLAGWLPSSRALPQDLADRWNVVVSPPHFLGAIPPQEVSREAEAQGEYLAEALLELNPSWIFSDAAPLEPLVNPFQEPAEEPVRDEEREAPLSPLAALRPGAPIPLARAPRGASDLLKELRTFARAVDRRWPDLDRWARRPVSQPEPIPETLFPSWIDELRRQKPEHVDLDQWRVKLDVLRSAAVMLLPKADMLRTVGPFESNRVPALLFFLLPGTRDRLAEMNDDSLRQALRQSLTCTPSPWTRRLRRELADWRPKKTRLKALVQEELDATRPQRA